MNIGDNFIRPFIAIYLKALGATPEIVGIIMSCRPFFTFIGSSLFGIIADKLQIHKELMLAGLASYVAVQTSIMFFNNIILIAFLIVLASLLNSPVTSTFDAAVLHIL